MKIWFLYLFVVLHSPLHDRKKLVTLTAVYCFLYMKTKIRKKLLQLPCCASLPYCNNRNHLSLFIVRCMRAQQYHRPLHRHTHTKHIVSIVLWSLWQTLDCTNVSLSSKKQSSREHHTVDTVFEWICVGGGSAAASEDDETIMNSSSYR